MSIHSAKNIYIFIEHKYAPGTSLDPQNTKTVCLPGVPGGV